MFSDMLTWSQNAVNPTSEDVKFKNVPGKEAPRGQP